MNNSFMGTNKPLFADYPDVVTIKQMMEMLHIGRSTADKLLNTGVIPYFKLGESCRVRYILKSEIIRMVVNKAFTTIGNNDIINNIHNGCYNERSNTE
ncbi:MAG: helix-turn-helix domain-containing protein [Oscillospiraceae bacterium]|nr:helix-turn-helix domain-containing protein [Oscillospiraceae bacterium]